MIYWTKKNSKESIFKKFQRILLKTIFNLFIHKKRFQFIFNKWFDSISFVFNFQKNLFTLNTIKRIIKSNIYNKKKKRIWFDLQRNDFYLPSLGK